MILDPTTDRACLGQLTQIARELVPTTLVHTVAARLGSRRAVIRWLQSLPQSDDDGEELYRYISCDVPQRVRLLPDDPNCFERAFAALAILEVLDPATPRVLVTIDRPVRHTGVAEKRGSHWEALDLFPRRNFDWGEFGKDILQGAHQYVGKPVLKFYLGADAGGKAADEIGAQENQLIGRDKRKAPAKKTQPEPAVVPRPVALRPVSVVARAEAGTAATSISDAKEGKDGSQEGKDASHAQAGGAGSSDDDRASSRVAQREKERWGWG